MRSSFAVTRSALSVLAGALATANAAFGPYFSTGPTASGIYILSSTATLVVPNPPSGSDGDLSLWVGMGTSNGDLIQSIVENWYGDSTWSTYAYTLEETSATSQTPVQGPSASLSAGAQVKMVYQYSASTGDYTQTVYLNGVVVSTLSTSDGYAEGWGSAVECAATNCGTVPQHQWLNVQIVLSGADPGYIDTFGLGGGAEATMSTPDGGVTWNVGTITIPQFDFTTGDSSPITSSGSTPTTTTTSAARSTTTSSSSGTHTTTSSSATQTLYGQCGGIGYTGPTACASGSTCQYDNAYYSQCLA